MSTLNENRRHEYIHEMERLYKQRPYSDKQLADLLGTGRENIFRIRKLMNEQMGIPIEPDPDQRGRYFIPKEFTISHIPLNRIEAAQLYLAGRRLQQQTRTSQRPVVSALEKLAYALNKPLAERMIRAAQVVLDQEQDPQQEAIFATLVECWLDGIPVRITHRKLHGDERTYRVHPYQLEPSVWGDGTYLIGYSEWHGKLATFKLARIEKAVKGTGTFTIPDDFDVHELLNHAWGIWHADEAPQTVTLRFSPFVTSRVRETIWHPQQTILVHDDGSSEWSAPVAEPREMIPWVRGWGADVEVMGPVGLRAEISEHVKSLALVYEVNQNTKSVFPTLALWAKADRKTFLIHRLVYHMIDVGMVAKELWSRSLHPQLRRSLADWVGLNEEETCRLVAFLCSLHDLGKASPAFQDHSSLREPLKGRIRRELESAGFSFINRTPAEKHTRHEVVSTWSLRSGQGEGLLERVCGFDSEFSDWIAQALGGHHGAWPRSDQFRSDTLTLADSGGQEWTNARHDLVSAMRGVFDPPTISQFGEDETENNIMLALLSAIVSVADWIGSNEDYFPLEEASIPISSYHRHAHLHAKQAVTEINWETPVDMPAFSFEDVFPFSPNSAQQEGISALTQIPLPALVIIEAQMGMGKTELAFATYANWAERLKSAGLYIAMPTTATSNQMHGRTAHFLSKQLRQQIEPMLVHSQALLQESQSSGNQVEEEDGERASAQSWFLPRKKSLLVPYGVGTVDQALMSVLQTKHFFVRLLGLSHKVVIFDEIHAYDAYMSELFEQLLRWLRAVNTSVIMLSATLPERTRIKLVKAYSGSDDPPPQAVYPRITFASADAKSQAISLTPPPSRTLRLDWLGRDLDEITARLREELRDGGCAAVICNTVGRVQEIFGALQQQDPPLCHKDDLILFHARFPMAWREEIEAKVLGKFGPGNEKDKRNPNRPQRAIVVATQVIEQSLDLDFDVMISDHAPIDLLLQRAGRLHRHAVNDSERSHPYCLWIAEPPIEDGVPQFGRGDKYVYDEYVLLRSWLAAKSLDLQVVRIPEDMSALIEDVYGDITPPCPDKLRAALDQALREMTADQFGEKWNAGKRRITQPSDEDLLWGNNTGLEEDDPTVHDSFQALTRIGRPGLQVVCLHRINGCLHLEPEEGSLIYDPAKKPDAALTRELARRTVTIRRQDIESYLLDEPTESEVKQILTQWKRIAVLRYHRVVIFEEGKYPLNGTNLTLVLDKASQLGLQVI